jgi:hypothetical protein
MTFPPPDPNRDYVTFAEHDDFNGFGPWVAMDSLGSWGTRFKTEAEALAHASAVHFGTGGT